MAPPTAIKPTRGLVPPVRRIRLRWARRSWWVRDAQPALPGMPRRTTVPIVFGVSFTEIAVVAVVTLIVVGPHKLPGMMRTLGEWLGRLRRLTTEMRVHSGIDEILRQEGITGGLNELRALVRGELSHIERAAASAANQPGSPDPYVEEVESDVTRESPVEGPDAYGALPDDLVDDAVAPDDRSRTGPPPPTGPSPAA